MPGFFSRLGVLSTALLLFFAPLAQSRDLSLIQAQLQYRVRDLRQDPQAEWGEAQAVFYRISFRPEDAQDVYDFWKKDGSENRDRAEIVNKLVREALIQEDYPTWIRLEEFSISIDSREPVRASYLPSEGDAPLDYQKMRVRTPGDGRSLDWVRRDGDETVRLLGKGELLEPVP